MNEDSGGDFRSKNHEKTYEIQTEHALVVLVSAAAAQKSDESHYGTACDDDISGEVVALQTLFPRVCEFVPLWIEAHVEHDRDGAHSDQPNEECEEEDETLEARLKHRHFDLFFLRCLPLMVVAVVYALVVVAVLVPVLVLVVLVLVLFVLVSDVVVLLVSVVVVLLVLVVVVFLSSPFLPLFVRCSVFSVSLHLSWLPLVAALFRDVFCLSSVHPIFFSIFFLSVSFYYILFFLLSSYSVISYCCS